MNGHSFGPNYSCREKKELGFQQQKRIDYAYNRASIIISWYPKKQTLILGDFFWKKMKILSKETCSTVWGNLSLQVGDESYSTQE